MCAKGMLKLGLKIVTFNAAGLIRFVCVCNCGKPAGRWEGGGGGSGNLSRLNAHKYLTKKYFTFSDSGRGINANT